MLGDFHLFHQPHCTTLEQIPPADTGRRQKNILFPTRSHTYFLCKQRREIKHLGKDLSVNLLKGERPEENRAAAPASHLVLSRSTLTSLLQGRRGGGYKWNDNSISQNSKSQCLPSASPDAAASLQTVKWGPGVPTPPLGVAATTTRSQSSSVNPVNVLTSSDFMIQRHQIV